MTTLLRNYNNSLRHQLKHQRKEPDIIIDLNCAKCNPIQERTFQITQFENFVNKHIQPIQPLTQASVDALQITELDRENVIRKGKITRKTKRILIAYFELALTLTTRGRPSYVEADFAYFLYIAALYTKGFTGHITDVRANSIKDGRTPFPKLDPLTEIFERINRTWYNRYNHSTTGLENPLEIREEEESTSGEEKLDSEQESSSFQPFQPLQTSTPEPSILDTTQQILSDLETTQHKLETAAQALGDLSHNVSSILDQPIIDLELGDPPEPQYRENLYETFGELLRPIPLKYKPEIIIGDTEIYPTAESEASSSYQTASSLQISTVTVKKVTKEPPILAVVKYKQEIPKVTLDVSNLQQISLTPKGKELINKATLKNIF